MRAPGFEPRWVEDITVHLTISTRGWFAGGSVLSHRYARVRVSLWHVVDRAFPSRHGRDGVNALMTYIPVASSAYEFPFIFTTASRSQVEDTTFIFLSCTLPLWSTIARALYFFIKLCAYYKKSLLRTLDQTTPEAPCSFHVSFCARAHHVNAIWSNKKK